MQKKLTITLDEEVYKGLHKIVGRGKIGKFLENLARPIVVRGKLESEYKAMATDRSREAEALEWAEAACEDIEDEERWFPSRAMSIVCTRARPMSPSNAGGARPWRTR